MATSLADPQQATLHPQDMHASQGCCDELEGMLFEFERIPLMCAGLQP